MPKDLLSEEFDPLSEEEAPSPEEIAGGEEAEQSFQLSKEQWEAQQAQLEEERQARQALEKRLADTSSWANQAHMARLQAEENVKAFTRAREQEQNWAQQIQRMPPPQIDYQKALEDPDEFKRALESALSYADARAMAYAQPGLEGSQMAVRELETLRGTAVDVLMQRAEAEWLDSGYDPDTFKAIRPRMRQYLRNNQGALQAAQTDGNAKLLAMGLADQERLPLQSTPVSASTAPPSSTASPHAQGPRVPPQINTAWQNVAAKFGLEGDDAKLSPEELAEVAEEHWH